MIVTFVAFAFSPLLSASEYERNKAVPVKEVRFGEVISVRKITERELLQDKANGWETFGGALIGGAIGYQFGDGSGQVAATILGSLIGANLVGNNQQKPKEKVLHLVELMIRTDNGQEYMVVQDYDSKMLFEAGNAIRLIYLANGSVRVDKQY
ncbi:outer membrane lipoprotein [Thalassotalea algicola]|nr:glycine zipper 2TM domain-containing protein [Thalassotalea algicola]